VNGNPHKLAFALLDISKRGTSTLHRTKSFMFSAAYVTYLAKHLRLSHEDQIVAHQSSETPFGRAEFHDIVHGADCPTGWRNVT